MHSSGMHYFPLSWPFLIALAALFGLLAGGVAVKILTYTSARMGVGAGTMFAVLLLSLLGCYINIPVAFLPERQTLSAAAGVTYFGIEYVVPVIRDWPATVVAINVGGAVIPILLSIYLILRNGLYGIGLAGVAIVAAVCHYLAKPVPGLGIALPVFVPPLVTAFVAVTLSRRSAAPLAYVCGSLGTLIGADLMNLDKVQGLGAPIVSIGGAGSFDGIFLTGLLAVLIASLAGGAPARR